MKSLIWKEARQEFAMLIVALGLSTALFFLAGSVWNELVLPDGGSSFIVVPLAYAFVLAQVQFRRVEDGRHFGLLVHRRMGVKGYFLSRAVVGVVAMVLVVALPMTLWALGMRAFSPEGLLIRWELLPQRCAPSIPALVVYASGVFSTQLRRGRVVRWSIAVLGVGVGAMLALPLAESEGHVLLWVPLWAIACVGIALLALALAYQLLLAGRDRDLPLRDAHLCASALAILVLALPSTSALLGAFEAGELRVVQWDSPYVFHDPGTGEFLPMGSFQDGGPVLELRDGRIVGATDRKLRDQVWKHHAELPFDYWSFEPAGLEVVHMGEGRTLGTVKQSLADARQEQRLQWRSVQGPIGPDGSRPWAQFACFRAETRELEFFAKPVAGTSSHDRVPIRCVLGRPDRPFSNDVYLLAAEYRQLVLLDRADGSLWKVNWDRGSANLDRVRTPHDDPIVDFDTFTGRSGLAFGLAAGSTGQLGVFVGKADSYVLDDDELQAFHPSSEHKIEGGVPLREAERLARYSVSASWTDAFTEEVRVERLADHKTVFSLTSEPRTPEALQGAIVYSALSFVRAPAAVAAERFLGWISLPGPWMDERVSEHRLFRSGNRSLLFALVMLAGLVQVLVAWTWLARAGAGLATRIACALFVLSGGIVALLFTRLLLPRRVRHESRPAPANPRLALPAGV